MRVLRPFASLVYLIFAVASIALPGVVQAVPPVQFAAATNYVVPGAPVGISVADLNHDNWPDVVTVNQSGSSISVLLGLGGGAFQALTNYPVASNPVFVTVGDFDTNGQPDVVTANYAPYDGTVSVLSGTGDGTFFPATNWPAGRSAKAIAVADFNQDHNPDLAVVNTAGNQVLLLLGNGHGAFPNPITNSMPGGTLTFVISGDFNGDGLPDLAVTCGYSSSIFVMLGKGDGTFGAVSNYPATSGIGGAVDLLAVAGGDFNNDGKLDLVTANYGGSSTFLKGKGDGSFLATATNNVGNSPWAIAVGDFNGDGNLDFVTANTSSKSVTLRLGNGDGTFSTNIFLNVGGTQRYVAVADVNGDGRPDILTANYAANSVSVCLNQSIPALKIAPVNCGLRISWPEWAGYQLEFTTNLMSSWSAVTNVPVAMGGQLTVTSLFTDPSKYYRLSHP